MAPTESLAAVWKRVPGAVRKTIVGVIGGTVVVLGIALVVLPGPFTIPLLVLGFAILGTEFAWASRWLARARAGLDAGGRAVKRTGAAVAGAARNVTGLGRRGRSVDDEPSPPVA